MSPESNQKQSVVGLPIVIRRSIFILIVRMATLHITLLLTYFFGLYAATTIISNTLADLIVLTPSITLAYFIIALLLTAYVSLRWRYDYYEIRSDAVVHRYGVFIKKSKNYACNRIESVIRSQSFIGYLFDFGNISLYDPFLERKINLNNIPEPRIYEEIFRKQYITQNEKASPRESSDEYVSDKVEYGPRTENTGLSDPDVVEKNVM